MRLFYHSFPAWGSVQRDKMKAIGQVKARFCWDILGVAELWKTNLEWAQMNGEIDKNELWKAVCGELSVTMSGSTFMTWVRPCFIVAITPIDDQRMLVELGCPSAYHQQTVDERYYGQIKKALEGQTGKSCEIALVVKQGEEQVSRKEAKKVAEAEPKVDLFSGTDKWQDEEKSELLMCGLNPRFSFENLVVGNANNLAYAAARGVVDEPGMKHNPLFIWGGVGVGKTHLMHAVGRALRGKGLRQIRAITSEQFTNEFVSTIRNKTADEFKKKYRNVDALLIDDIQFFAGKESSQEEFFHTFNELYLKGKQIILTADRRPQDIAQVEQRLISRFLGGLTVDIGMPDYEMRLAILKQKCNERGIQADEAALDMLANNASTNSRELSGILDRLASLASLKGQRLDSQLVEGETGIKAKKQEKHLRPQEVISLVARLHEYKNKDLLGTSRKAELVRARHIAFYVLRKEMGLTLERVAEMMGNRDHTTIMHGIEKIEREFAINQEVREQVMKVKQEIYR